MQAKNKEDALHITENKAKTDLKDFIESK